MERFLPSGKYLIGAVLLVVAACESPPAMPATQAAPGGPEAAAEPPLGSFAAARAFADAVALADLAAPGGEDAKRAVRSYVTSELGATGLAVVIQSSSEPPGGPDTGAEPRSWSHVIATAPGASSDLFLLVAPLGDAAAGADVEALREETSGAALLLELARVLSTRSLPYTTSFVWIDGEGWPGGSADTPDLRGSRSLAAQLAARGDLARVRLLLALDRVCRGDLRIARDLRSHRVYREEFFDAAARIGRTDVFARTQTYESVDASHLAFRDAGVRPVVALTASGSPGAPSQGHPCTAQSLDAVGVVALDALDAIGRRLAKIDRFSRAPLASADEKTPSPGPPPAELPGAVAPAVSGPVNP